MSAYYYCPNCQKIRKISITEVEIICPKCFGVCYVCDTQVERSEEDNETNGIDKIA